MYHHLWQRRFVVDHSHSSGRNPGANPSQSYPLRGPPFSPSADPNNHGLHSHIRGKAGGIADEPEDAHIQDGSPLCKSQNHFILALSSNQLHAGNLSHTRSAGSAKALMSTALTLHCPYYTFHNPKKSSREIRRMPSLLDIGGSQGTELDAEHLFTN